MKRKLGIFTSACALGLAQANSTAAPVRFDFDAVDPQPPSTTQAGWIAAPAGNGTDGTVTIATSAIGAVTVDTRNRTGTAFDAGGGEEADMWNDFVFANGSFAGVAGSGLQIDITGLAANSSFPITVWAFDDGSNPAGGFGRSTDWNVDSTLVFPADPDPATLDDYNVTFTAASDADGNLTITGTVAATDPSSSHNVFINGLQIGDALTDVDDDGLADAFEQDIIDADPEDAIATIDDVLPEDDFDNDGSSNAEEAVAGTDPTDDDSDDDGFLDGVEDKGGVWVSATETGTDPNVADTDGDGLVDGVENHDLPYDANDPENQPGSDPNLVDTDGDARSDAREVFVDGTDPTDENDFFDPLLNAIAKFDFNAAGSPTLAGWTAADLGSGSDGSVSVATEAIGGVTLDTRDRIGTNTDGPGADIGNDDMWRDFVFANGSFDTVPGSGLRITLSGLQASTVYPITIWAFDESSNNSRDADWGAPGEEATTLAFPTAPDPASLVDYMITIEVVTDASGVAVIEGIVAAVDPDPSHNVFVNGLAVGSPAGGGVLFQITKIEHDKSTGTVRLTWNSIPNRFYNIFATKDLATEIWQELDDGFESQGETTTYEYSGDDPDPAVEPRLFFRVEQ